MQIYYNQKQLQEVTGRGHEYIRRVVRTIEQHIDRYGEYAIVDGLIHISAFVDCVRYRKALKNSRTKEVLPEFKPDKVLPYCTYEQL